MKTRPQRLLAAAATMPAAAPALAHEGHGMFGGHWHATDAWGFVAPVAAVLVAVWLSRGGK
jgi:hypothetical protein